MSSGDMYWVKVVNLAANLVCAVTGTILGWETAFVLFFWLLGMAWSFALGRAGFNEADRIRRRIRKAEMHQEVIRLRAQAEQAEAAARQALERYMEGPIP